MPTPIPEGMRLGVAEPRDAMAAFEQRGLLQPSFRWQDVWQEEHSRAFAVAGVSRLDVLKVFRDELDEAIATGRSPEEFRARIRPQLAGKGFWGNVEVTDPDTGETRISKFNDRRLQLIFDVNMRQSQAVGRWERAQRTKRRFPLLVYVTMHDERVRASHQAWDYLVLPIDHPFWNTHLPPNGWRCRCMFYATDERGVERLIRSGHKVRREPPEVDWIPYVNSRTGEVVPVPRGIDPGFAYNPAKKRDAAFHEAALQKAVESSPLSAAVTLAQATADYPAMVTQATREFSRWVDQLSEVRRAAGEVRHVGTLPPPIVRALQQRQREPQTAVISVRDEDVLHTLRDSKAGSDAALPPGVYRHLPELLQRVNALLLEAETGVLLYVVDLVREDGQVVKLVLKMDMTVKMRLAGGKPARVPLNIVRTATVMDPNALRDRARYELLWGRVE